MTHEWNGIDRRLIITVGYPRCGKSTWAKGTGIPVVSSDAIRMAIFGQLWYEASEHWVLPFARTMVRSLFFAGHSRVIWDSVNITEALRTVWRPSPDMLWERTYTIFNTTADECRRRADATDRPYLKGVIDRMEAIYEPVQDWEYGFEAAEDRGEENFVPGGTP